MKKLIALCALLPILSYAGVSYISEPSKFGSSISYHVKCTDGGWDTVLVTNGTVYSSNRLGYIGNNIGVSESARRGCETQVSTKKADTKKTIIVKKEALVFEHKDGENGIANALRSELSYISLEALASMSGKKDGRFLVDADSKVEQLEYFKPHKVLVDKNGNYLKSKSGLKKGQYKYKTIIDGYYKVSDSNNRVFYVRKSATK